MENSFKELCAFLGESPPPKTKSDELFSTISRFVGQFKTATTKYKEKSERKAKAAQRDAAKAAMKVKLKDATGDSPPSLATNNPRPPASKAQGRGLPKPPVPKPPGVRGPPRGASGGRGAPRLPPGVKAPGSVAPGAPRPKG